jgi:inhibitor of cysteine peptidase
MKKCLFVLMIVMTAVLTACGGEETAVTNTPAPTDEPATPTPALSTPTGETIRGQATVDSVQILTLESFPVQINVRVRGELADRCTIIEEVITQRNDSTFQSVVTTVRPGDAVCTTEPLPFEEVISLDVVGLMAGTYEVTVNGISGSFTLDVDNIVPGDEPSPTPEPAQAPTPTPIPSDPESAAISGKVWHDLCAVAGGEGDEEAEPSEGCLELDSGAFQANGILEDGEPGLEGVVVSLGTGNCPVSGLAVTATDSNGDFAFVDLPAGDYCVSVDPLGDDNSELLLPGGFTAPDEAVGEVSLTVAEGEVAAAVNFGWDYQFLPIPDVDLATCTNSVQYVDDLTIPDDTVLAPGESFVKSWRLRNNGTCPWLEGYKIIAIDDEPLPGETEVVLATAVAPGQAVDISVNLTAPDITGTYRSNWQMETATGVIFGVDGFIEDAFWLQIVVAEDAAPVEPNSGVIGGVVWDDFCTLTGSGTPTSNCVETEAGSGFFVANGTFNGNEVSLPDVKVTIVDGACPLEGGINPADIIATTTTDAEGLYSFTDLEGGTYCVFVDAFDEDNVDLLIPGDWTYPARGVGRLGIILAEGEERLTVDFGWDYLD